MATVKMNQENIENLLNRAMYGRLATKETGYPYIVPLCFLYYRGRLYFHSRLTGKKIEALATNPRVCMQVDEVTGLISSPMPCKFNVAYESVIIQGMAKIIMDADIKKEILELLARKYSGDQELAPIKPEEIEHVAIVEISIDNIHGKANSF